MEVEPGAYRHFKGGLYWAFGTARHSETEEPLVIYRALYGDAGLWARPCAMFSEQVDAQAYPSLAGHPRFAKIADDDPDVLAVRAAHPAWFSIG